MKRRYASTLLGAIALIALLFSSPAQAISVRIPPNFANDSFKSLWIRTDAVVDDGSVKRGYYWGPTAGYTTSEEYAEGVNGEHLVQYFDKSRMEINNPTGNKEDPFYVTNGLLTRELIGGKIQTGNTRFIERYSAEINIASDLDDRSAETPTYASFKFVAGDASQSRSKTGQIVQDRIERSGITGPDSLFGSYGVRYAYFEAATRHNIPDKFWDFLNATGPVMVDGKQVNARLSDPYFYATGYPISEAYWAEVKIAGEPNTAVLIQPYERRVLTYVPSAPESFKVQMGNIGQHYYAWRYQEAGRPVPPPVRCSQVPIRGFGKIWAENTIVQNQLGCTFQPERAATVSHQYFEHGEMLGVTQQYNPYGPAYRTIFVLFDDYGLQPFPDNFVEGDPEPAISPPPGLYAPVRGFGKVWREGTGARVRERLGWATGPETLAPAQIPPPYNIPGPVPTATPRVTATPVPPGLGGAIQDFTRGTMIYAGPVLKKIYVLYNPSGYNPQEVTRWSVYDDKFVEP